MSDKSFLCGKTILITGGTGSFGKAFIKHVMKQHTPKKIIVFSRDEWKQWQMRHEDAAFAHPALRYFLGDVRDKERLMRAFNGVDIIVHAAALKQVPAAEYNPAEYVKTNIMGSMNVIDAAIDGGVEKVIALSTDKAVNPLNLYGATKLCADKLFIAGNAYVGAVGKPKFSVVRYGNVLDSRGSLLPLWRDLIKKGCQELPITDMRMTRFWVTIEQAVAFVLASLERMGGGEIFTPKVPSMKIADMAQALAPCIPVKVCGIRYGEKLHEALISHDEARNAYELEDCYILLSEFLSRTEEKYPWMREAKRVEESFSYTSENNEQWLSTEALKEEWAKC